MGTHLSGPFKSQQINNVSFLKGVMSELNLGGWQGGGGGDCCNYKTCPQLQEMPQTKNALATGQLSLGIQDFQYNSRVANMSPITQI